MTKSWFDNWPAMDLASIQAWIEALPHNITEIIRLEGGNEYKEGRESREHTAVVGRLVSCFTTPG